MRFSPGHSHLMPQLLMQEFLTRHCLSFLSKNGVREVGSVSEGDALGVFGDAPCPQSFVCLSSPAGKGEQLLRKELWGFQHWVESSSRAEGLPGMGHQNHLPALIPKGKHWNTFVWSSSL